MTITLMPATAPVLITSSYTSFTEDSTNATVSGITKAPLAYIGCKEDGSPQSISCAFFHLLNFPPYRGAHLHRDGRVYYGRGELAVGKWRVTLDQFEKTPARFEEAEAIGGSLLTHVGCIRRVDDKLFSIQEASKLLDALYWFFCFTAGSRCGYTLCTGYRNRNVHWDCWAVTKTSPPKSFRGWVIRTLPQAAFDACAKFYETWQSEQKRQWLRLAISLYTAANNNTNGIELALANSQIALELLCWVALLEESTLMSEEGFSKLAAADRLRMLVFWLGLKPSIPSGFSDLANAFPSADAPKAVTDLRNYIIHPTPSNRGIRSQVPDRAVYQAWQYNLWLVELTLLKLIGFDGPYHNRTGLPPGRMWDWVPWGEPKET